jgi:hypothetical protein
VIPAALEWLAHIGLAAIQVLGWFGAGSLLMRRLRTGLPAVDALNALGSGAVAFALLTFFAGVAGLLRTELVAALTLCGAVAGAIAVGKAVRGVRLPTLRGRPRWLLAFALPPALTILLALVAVGAPVNSYDALAYHVSVPAIYEEHGRIVELPWSWHSYQPFTVEMLITDGLLLWNPVQGAFAPLALVLGATAAVVTGGRLVAGDAVGWLAGAIFVTQPLVAWESTASLVDGGIAFVVALAALNVLVWARTRATAPLLAAGLFAGSAAGMKYVGLYAALAVGLAVLLAARRHARLAALAALALPAALVALPWYAKNWLQTGNPVFPFVFGGAGEAARAAIDRNLESYGFGRSPVDALLLPFRLVADGDAFDGGDWLSPLVLLAPPLALLDKSRRHGTTIALLAVLVYLGCWFATSQQGRFLVPLVPLLAVLVALAICAVARVSRIAQGVALTATAAALAVGLGTFALFAAQFFPVVFGLESDERFLSKRTWYYDGVVWLNRELDRPGGVLIDFASPYLERPYIVWTPLALPPEAKPATAARLARSEDLAYAALLETDDATRRRFLAAMGARHVATVDVHTAFLGLREWGGVPHKLLIYQLATEPPAPPTPLAASGTGRAASGAGAPT